MAASRRGHATSADREAAVAMFKWIKLGQVFDPTTGGNGGWMKQYAQAPSALVFPDTVRVYFSTRPAADPQGQHLSYLAFVDLDRRNLLRVVNVCRAPVMPLGAKGAFDEFGIYPASVVRDGEDLRVYYAGWTRCESVPFDAAIGVAVSHDAGDSFVRVGAGPVLSHSVDEPYVLGSPKVRRFNDRWYLWYASGRRWTGDDKPEPVYRIRLATSEDGLTWVPYGQDLIETPSTDDECQASPDVFWRDGKYHMFFSYRHYASRRYRIGYACSTNLLTWSRNDATAGLDVSQSGWDAESVSYGHVFGLDEAVYMLYQGNEVGKYGFGLAKLDGHF